MFFLRYTAGYLLLLSFVLIAAPSDAQTDEDTDDGEAIPRVIPVFDPGSHTQPICALGFSSDKKKLITVGEDSSIQIWSTSTGERLDILRLPAYGHEQVSNTKAWNVASVSEDGRFVAIGGGQRKSLSEGNKFERAKLLLVDVTARTVRPIKSPNGVVTAVAFAPDLRLAVAYNGASSDVLILPDVRTGEVKRRKTQRLFAADVTSSATFLKFSPDGKQLFASYGEDDVVLWDLSGSEPTITKRFAANGTTSAVAWSPDHKRFARARTPGVRIKHGFEIHAANGELVQSFEFAQLKGFDKLADLRSLSFIDSQTLLLASSDAQGRFDPGSFAYRFDLKSEQATPIFDERSAGLFHNVNVMSGDGELAAITVSMGLDAVVYLVKDGSVVSRCGAASPVPTVVGWAKEPHKPAFAWSEIAKPGKGNTKAEDLQFGFDLASIEPIVNFKPTEFETHRDSVGDWSITKGAVAQIDVQQKDQTAATLRGGTGIMARTLVPRGTDPPLVLWAANRSRTASAVLTLSKSNGEQVARLNPEALFVRDIAPSTDGRFAVVSTGMHRLRIYAMEGPTFPLLSFARVNGEWVLWSNEGYYAASPGGEKMIGWSVSNGPNQLATFHTAEKFATHLRRPDLLKRAIELGSMELALQHVETRAPAVEQLLPPKGSLKLIRQSGGRVQVQATAIPGAPDKPVIAIRVLLDGRPLGNGVTQKVIAPGERAEANWEFEFPGGSHELKLLIRSEDSSAISEPLILQGAKTASQKPVVYRLCVGVDEYAIPALNLTSAAKDATDMYVALEKHCVGNENRFGTAGGTLLINHQATQQSVLKALSDIRKRTKPGDLVVFVFAGHGIKQKEEFYLMTHEADPSQSLKGKSLSGTELHTELKDMQCPVLLVLDACHSASSVKSFRPATDDLTRSLTDDSAGVTVLAAAMSHEVASATSENGYFTAAFLKALELSKGTPYDQYDHVLYTHHIYSVVFSEVRRATNGKQNPFLNMPWTVPPLGLRDVPR